MYYAAQHSFFICVYVKLGQGIIVMPSYEKVRFPNGFANSSGLKSVFLKFRFCDGLVQTEGLTGELKLHFQIPPMYTVVGTGLKKLLVSFAAVTSRSHVAFPSP